MSDDADRAQALVASLQPSLPCTCTDSCPRHGKQSLHAAVKDLDAMRWRVINLATRYEVQARDPSTVTNLIKSKVLQDKATELWHLLGECVCRTETCGHPSSFHTNGSCVLCFGMTSKKVGPCWA